jgi:membrane-associated protease RseP (regulator of RpoE activity)
MASDPASAAGDPPGPGPSPTEPTPPPPPDEESAPSPPQAQNAPQDRWNQDQAQDNDDDDRADSATPSTGQSHLGVMIMGLTPELRRFFGVTSDRGVLVARVEPGSAAARAGVQVGDVLVRVGRQQVHTGNDVVQALGTQGGGAMRIAVVRQGRIVRLDATLPGARRNMQQRSIQQHQL